MKKHLLSLIIICLLSLPSAYFGDLKEKIILTNVLDKINTYHFQPKPIDDKLSKDIFSLYLKRLDPNKQFLIKEDIKKLREYELLIDDQLLNGGYSFYLLADHLYKKRFETVKVWYKEILSAPFDFKIIESIPLKSEDYKYTDSEQALKKHWKKILKYQTLAEYISNVEQTPSSNLKEFQPNIEIKAREVIKKNTTQLFDRLSKETEDEKFTSYINTISNTFDPHTNYLSPASKEDFDISISGKLEGIGAVLREDNGLIKVVRIVSGSASWRQKELEAEDIILEVSQGNEEPVNIEGARVRDAVKLIRGKKGTEVRLTVRKPDGEEKVIPIIRDIVIIEETYAKSTIITNEALNKRFGYILLPGFYRDFKDSKARNSSTDVKNELLKLKAQHIDGVILDLRNNGGGALNDAVDMAGLFLRSGPIVQVKNRINRGRVWSDTDPSIVYDGPLVILINSFSASASEIVAAALQDYRRAIIIGSESSYGKGTVQTFLDLDRYTPSQFKSLQPFGSLKLTIQKFYRVNGQSTQYNGVVPDISLPFSTDSIKIGEKTLDHSLAWTTVNSVKFSNSSRHLSKLNQIKEKSKLRVSNNTFFNSIQAFNIIKNKRKNKKEYSLNLEKWISNKEKTEKENEKYNLKLTPIKGLAIPSPNIIGENAEQKIKDTINWHKELKKDHYINESILVLNDLINHSSQ